MNARRAHAQAIAGKPRINFRRRFAPTLHLEISPNPGEVLQAAGLGPGTPDPKVPYYTPDSRTQPGNRKRQGANAENRNPPSEK